ncbi:NAD-dependent succinate-semialdehyde dehydrogenase [Blastococcus sp. SYSU D00820]
MTATTASPALDWFPHRLLIGGSWEDGPDGSSIDVRNPADGRVIASVPDADVATALRAVDAAAAAAEGWAATPPRRRGEVLRAAFELMLSRADDLARLIVLENGKSLTDARSEVAYAAEFMRWYAEEAVRLVGSVQRSPSGSNRIVVNHVPVGISVLVTPWNFPAAMATRKIAPALAAGCPVILKPASETPLTALAVTTLLHEAGVPAGVVNVLTSRRSGAVVDAMLDDPRVRKLSFTGSTEVGRVLLASAARTVVNCSMELGGNAPLIVLEDADVDLAVEGAMVAKMRNGGSACTAANRILVHRSVLAEFGEKLAARMGALVVGDGLEDGVDVGPLVNEATRTKVAELVADSVAAGASVATGGHPLDRPGFFYPPTVLLDVPAGAPVLTEEIFGPVAPLVAFDTDDEAVRLANDTEYGLVGYVFTRDLARGLRVSERLEVGMVGLNRGVVSDPAAPFGGFKQSGLGREGGHEGLLEFTESQYIAVDW